MNSDDIYKIIGYAVVIIFGFYIVSKSLNLQFKIIEGMTRQERKDKEKDKEKQEDKDRKEKKKEEKGLSKDIDLIIREIHISNNNNIKKIKKYNKELIYEVVKLFENYITTEKINLFNIINNKNTEITFSMIIDDLKDACGKISSLTKGINYLSSTSDGDLEEDVKKTEEEEEAEEAEEEEAKKKEKGKTKEEKDKDKEDEDEEIASLKELNETELEYNNDDVKDISSTADELKTSYLNLLNAYINEEKISISELMKEISEDTTTYQDNMNEIDIHNINISILQESESILTELFDGGVGRRRKKGKKKSAWS